ncbi:type II toxin-antitoxin system VapC family toxin [bacterium]|nr:type II toxin-antitoxin system VapC family toxin [bacterium]MCI0604582.1 type II toxin-antitoxin system VapC family toxin [bacterium]
MITAVDTNVLLDIFTADIQFGSRSAERLSECMIEGKLIGCEVVLAEIAASFSDIRLAEEALQQLGVEFAAMDQISSLQAGVHWKKYRASGGTRTRIISDFLIGSHASNHADRLLTRDRGFYRKYFSKLIIIDPSSDE